MAKLAYGKKAGTCLSWGSCGSESSRTELTEFHSMYTARDTPTRVRLYTFISRGLHGPRRVTYIMMYREDKQPLFIVWMKMSRIPKLKIQASLDVTSHRLVYTSYQCFGITCSICNYGSLQWAAWKYNSGRIISFPYLTHTLSPYICYACHPSCPFLSCSSYGSSYSTEPSLTGLLLWSPNRTSSV
jgi:hypothetical protein